MSVKYKIRDQHGLNFMTCTIVGWIDLFSRKVYRDMVIDSWKHCQKEKDFQIHAYVFMTNHIHLVVSCKSPNHLAAVMRDWKRHTARRILEYLQDETNTESRRTWILHMFSYFAYGKKNKQEYQVWEHDNHPIELYSETVIAQKVDYIHLNPVKAGWVELPEQWLYSSAPFYAFNSENAPFRAEPYEPLIEIMSVWKWFYEDGPGKR